MNTARLKNIVILILLLANAFLLVLLFSRRAGENAAHEPFTRRWFTGEGGHAVPVRQFWPGVFGCDLQPDGLDAFEDMQIIKICGMGGQILKERRDHGQAEFGACFFGGISFGNKADFFLIVFIARDFVFFG